MSFENYGECKRGFKLHSVHIQHTSTCSINVLSFLKFHPFSFLQWQSCRLLIGQWDLRNISFCFFSASKLKSQTLNLWNGFIGYSAASNQSRWSGYSAGYQACSVSTCQRIISRKSLSAQQPRNTENRGLIHKEPTFWSKKINQRWQDRHIKVRINSCIVFGNLFPVFVVIVVVVTKKITHTIWGSLVFADEHIIEKKCPGVD